MVIYTNIFILHTNISTASFVRLVSNAFSFIVKFINHKTVNSMNFNDFYLCPSEIYQRMEELAYKSELEYLSPEESEELDYLSYQLEEQSYDFPFDY